MGFRTVLFTLLLTLSSLAGASDLPDLSKTPGAVRPGLTKAKICAIKWGKDERHATAAMKKQVFDLYGYSGYDDPRCVPAGKRTCEIDHLISRELEKVKGVYSPNLRAAFAVHFVGLILERWFFFAQANHPQNLYCQTV